MMNTNSKLTLLLILLLNFGYGQEIVFEQTDREILPPESNRSFGNVYYIEHENSFTLIFAANNKTSICLFDSSFSLMDKALILEDKYNYSKFLKYYGTEKKQIMMFDDNAYSFDFDSRKTLHKEFEFKSKEEKFLGKFSNGDMFYVLTLFKESMVFRLHIFDSDLNYEYKDIDIKKNPFYYDNKLIEFPSRPDYIFNYIFNSESTVDFGTVPQNEPKDLSIITQAYKLYVEGNKLILTFDSNKDLNSLIEIDLENFSTITKQIRREFFTPDENMKAISNSFLLDNKLFLLKGTKEKVSVNVLDVDSKTYVFKQIFDSNTPYYVDRNLMISKDILEKHDIPEPTKEKDVNVENRLKHIMRMLPNSHVGIRVIENDKSYFITLGKYWQGMASAPAMMNDGLGGVNGPQVVFSTTYSFIGELSLNFYLSKSDFSLELDDYVDPYERMEDFLDQQYDNKADKKILWKTKFKKGDDYILGYYDKEEEKYYLRKFN